MGSHREEEEGAWGLIHGLVISHCQTDLFCASVCVSLSLCFPSQLVFSFCDKLFGLVIKDIEAMDTSILKGEQSSSKKQKVPDQITASST